MKESKKEIDYSIETIDMYFHSREEVRTLKVEYTLKEDEELKVYAVKKEPRTIEDFAKYKGWTEREFLDKVNAFINECHYDKTVYSNKDILDYFKDTEELCIVDYLKIHLK